MAVTTGSGGTLCLFISCGVKGLGVHFLPLPPPIYIAISSTDEAVHTHWYAYSPSLALPTVVKRWNLEFLMIKYM